MSNTPESNLTAKPDNPFAAPPARTSQATCATGVLGGTTGGSYYEHYYEHQTLGELRRRRLELVAQADNINQKLETIKSLIAVFE